MHYSKMALLQDPVFDHVILNVCYNRADGFELECCSSIGVALSWVLQAYLCQRTDGKPGPEIGSLNNEVNVVYLWTPLK